MKKKNVSITTIAVVDAEAVLSSMRGRWVPQIFSHVNYTIILKTIMLWMKASKLMKIKELSQLLNQLRIKKYGDLDSQIFKDSGIISNNNNDFETVVCGIDIGLKEIYAVERNGFDIGRCLFLSHHPIGRFAEEIPNAMKFYEKTVFQGCSDTSFLNQEIEYQRRLYMNDNTTRESHLLESFSLNCMCIHTLADMLAYDYLNNCVSECDDVETAANTIASLPEMKSIGKKVAFCKNRNMIGTVVPIVSGGCMFSSELFSKVQCDTIIVPGYSPELESLSKKYDKNIIFGNHMALDSLGMNLLLADLNLKCDLPVSGYIYVDRLNR